MIPERIRKAFDAEGDAEVLREESSTVRIGKTVIKKLDAFSLENDRSLELASWLAAVLAEVDEDGFRLARPVRTADQRWMSDDGWTAWRFVPGRSATASDADDVLAAIRALHRRLSHVPKHPALDTNTTAWGFAHHHCWSGRPHRVHPVVAPLVDGLYSRMTPLPPLPCQLIHGDLNPENVLILRGHFPGFIDFAPFWAPVDFAVAMFANWIGPRLGDTSVLEVFANEPHFRQLLLRAAARMLLVVSELGRVDEWSTEQRAAELVLSYVDRRGV